MERKAFFLSLSLTRGEERRGEERRGEERCVLISGCEELAWKMGLGLNRGAREETARGRACSFLSLRLSLPHRFALCETPRDRHIFLRLTSSR